MPRPKKGHIGDNQIWDYLTEIRDLLTEEQRNLFSQHARVQTFHKKQVIYTQGDHATHLICLLSGTIKIFKDGVGSAQIIRLVNAIGYFGYRANWANEPYMTKAAALDTTTLCFIPMHIITDIIQENGRFALFFIKLMATDMGASEERIVSLSQKHIRGRLADALIYLLDTYGVEEDGYTLSIYLSRDDLAKIANMTTSNAIRTMVSFVEEGVLILDGRKIKIVNAERLRRIAHIGG